MNKLLKLAKMLLHFAEIQTDKGVLTVAEDLAVGVEVAVFDENGEPVPASDGEYLTETQKIVVKDGKVESIEEIVKQADEDEAKKKAEEEAKAAEEAKKAEEEKKKQEMEDEKDLKIQELEGLLKDRDAVIAELTAKVKELEDKLKEPQEKEVELKKIAQEKAERIKANPALKYFVED